MEKRILLLVVALTVAISMMPALAFAGTGDTFQADITVTNGDDENKVSCTFEITDEVDENGQGGKVQIGTGEEFDNAIHEDTAGKLTIPETVEKGDKTYTVTALGDYCFYGCSSLESTGLEENSTVTALGDYCFSGCTKLESTGLETNSTVKTLGASCFYGCTKLESIGLEKNSTVTALGDRCFYGCSSLKSTGLETNSTVISLGDWCFFCCSRLESTGLETNSTVTALGDWCFASCTKLESTGLEENSTVTALGAQCFYSCSSLESTGLEENSTVTALGDYCFSSCTKLEGTGLETNSTVTTLGGYCFSSCSSLKSTGLEKNITVTTLGKYCFAECKGIVNAALPKNLKDASKGFFDNCTNLKTVYFAGKYLDGIDLFGDPITVYYRASDTSWEGIGKTKFISKADTYTSLIKITAKGGKITNSPANVWKSIGLWAKGEAVNITADVPAAHVFAQWTSDKEEVEFDNPAKASTSFKAPLKDTTVTGVFKKNKYTIKAVASPSKGGTVTKTKKAPYEGKVTLKAKAKKGYKFVKWTEKKKTVSTKKTLSVKNIKKNHTYKAVFKKVPVSFTLKAKGSTIKVHWETVKGAAGYQIANSYGGNKIKIWWTGSNGNNTYTSLHKKNGKTYKFKMRYYKVKDGKRVWSKWTDVKSIKK